MTGLGKNIFDKFFQRQKRKEFKVMETKATEAQDQHVYNQFPNENEIVHEQNIIAILKERTCKRFETINLTKDLI